MVRLFDDLLAHARNSVNSNAIVVPVLQTFNLLLEAGALERLSDIGDGLVSLKLLFSLSSRRIGGLKNIQRIHESIRMVVNLLSFKHLYNDCIRVLANCLVHPFPRIRSDTAEKLYLALQTKDVGIETEEAESLLLETEWSSNDISVAERSAKAWAAFMIREDSINYN